jgi:hypothetical protein
MQIGEKVLVSVASAAVKIRNAVAFSIASRLQRRSSGRMC